jgi:hypothetical protein
MSRQSDAGTQAPIQDKTLFLAAIGAPRSAKTYLAIQWGAVVAQLVFFVAISHWVASPTLRIALILASVVVSLKLLATLRPPSLQVKRQTDSGVRVSGQFEQRYIPMHQAIAMDSVAIEGNRLIFRTQAGNTSGTVSLNGDAFAVVGIRTLHDLTDAIFDGDAETFASIAGANHLKLRQRPRATGVSSIEPRWLHAAMLIGSLGIIALFYALRHYFLQ